MLRGLTALRAVLDASREHFVLFWTLRVKDRSGVGVELGRCGFAFTPVYHTRAMLARGPVLRQGGCAFGAAGLWHPSTALRTGSEAVPLSKANFAARVKRMVSGFVGLGDLCGCILTSQNRDVGHPVGGVGFVNAQFPQVNI